MIADPTSRRTFVKGNSILSRGVLPSQSLSHIVGSVATSGRPEAPSTRVASAREAFGEEYVEGIHVATHLEVASAILGNLE